MKNRKKSPQLVETKIERLSHDGRGITHLNGKTVFVSGALPGETVTIRLVKKRSSFNEAITTQVHTASELRCTPPCSHFSSCGGCTLQHLPPTYQLELKEKALLEQLFHLAQAIPEEILPPLRSKSLGYRKKARLGVKHVPGKHKVLVGFREKQSSLLADLQHCPVLHPSVGEQLQNLSELFYTLETRDSIPQLEIAVDDTTTAIIVRHLVELPAPDLEKLIQFAAQHQLKLYLQPKGPDSIKLIYPSGSSEQLSYTIADFNLTMAFHPSQFIQVNSEINQAMITQAVTLLDLQKTDSVLDLFCGIGNFTLPLATRCAKVIGVEGDEHTLTQAKINASTNQIHNIEFYTENLFDPPYSDCWQNKQFNKLLLDPPRSGAKEVMPKLAHWHPEKIVYVSCNPATLARDTAMILKNGYTLSKVGVMDMFPHTQHVESIALFTKM